jgi:hypothetical protein
MPRASQVERSEDYLSLSRARARTPMHLGHTSLEHPCVVTHRRWCQDERAWDRTRLGSCAQAASWLRPGATGNATVRAPAHFGQRVAYERSRQARTAISPSNWSPGLPSRRGPACRSPVPVRRRRVSWGADARQPSAACLVGMFGVCCPFRSSTSHRSSRAGRPHRRCVIRLISYNTPSASGTRATGSRSTTT